MPKSSGLNDYFRTQESALKLRDLRQTVLTSNLSHTDTPRFKARDFDFAKAYQQAIGALTLSQVPLKTSHPRHLQAPSSFPNPFSPPMLYRIPQQGAIDGNTVETESETVRLTDNTLRYHAALVFMQGRLRALKTAVGSSMAG